MSFDTYESRILIHSVPLPSVGIAGAVGFEILYFIVNLLFRWINKKPSVPVPVVPVVFLRFHFSSILYITIYILISYIVIKGCFIPLILIGTTGTGTTETLGRVVFYYFLPFPTRPLSTHPTGFRRRTQSCWLVDIKKRAESPTLYSPIRKGWVSVGQKDKNTLAHNPKGCAVVLRLR